MQIQLYRKPNRKLNIVSERALESVFPKREHEKDRVLVAIGIL
jgi:hypothetical protein